MGAFGLSPSGQNVTMVGNPLRSDILPILELGGSAAYIPYEITWQHETTESPVGHSGFYQLEHIGQLPALLEKLGDENLPD